MFNEFLSILTEIFNKFRLNYSFFSNWFEKYLNCCSSAVLYEKWASLIKHSPSSTFLMKDFIFCCCSEGKGRVRSHCQNRYIPNLIEYTSPFFVVLSLHFWKWNTHTHTTKMSRRYRKSMWSRSKSNQVKEKIPAFIFFIL